MKLIREVKLALFVCLYSWEPIVIGIANTMCWEILQKANFFLSPLYKCLPLQQCFTESWLFDTLGLDTSLHKVSAIWFRK